MAEQQQLNLLSAVDENQNSVRTKSLDLSFNELLDMYNSSELRINPEYQRLFRWSEGKQSRFIESLILEMPLPPIFMIEEDNSKYELIDGLQRISSYLHFRGYLTAPHLDIKKDDKLELSDCDIIEQLNGFTYDDLPEAMRIRLKRMFIRVEVIRRETDPRLRYHMFKRLNTGGENLSEQEIRNCTIRLLDDKFNSFIIRLSRNQDFQKCLQNLSDEQRLQLFDQELVLRFFTFKNIGAEYKHDVTDFMTDYMERVSERKVPFEYDAEEKIFVKTFAVLARTLGERSFGWVGKGGDLVARFSAYHFEALTLGLQAILDRIVIDNDAQLSQLRDTIMEIKKDPTFIEITTGGGKNSRLAWGRRVDAVRKRLLELA